MRKSIKLPEGTEEIWRRFRMMCLKKQTGGDGLANRQLVVLMEAWVEGEGINPEAVPELLKACQLAAKEIYHLMSELGDDPTKVGCYTTLTRAIAKAAD